MKRTVKFLIAAALCAVAVVPASAQKMHMAVDLQNVHLWRGIEVNNGFVIGSDLSISDNQDHFRFGLWGGYKLGRNTASEYKEFDYYMQYQINGFKIALWDFNNFSGIEDPQIFCYQTKKTNHFLDLQLSYTLPVEKFPLTLGWATTIWGNDRYTNLEGNDIGKTQNVYSTYISADLPVWHSGRWSAAVGLGAAFALNPAEGNDNFKYGEDGFGLVQATVSVGYDLKVTDKYHIPVTMMGWWNPDASKGNMMVNFRVLDF